MPATAEANPAELNKRGNEIEIKDPRIADANLIEYTVKFETNLPEGVKRKLKKHKKPVTTLYLSNKASWATFKAALLTHLSNKYDKDIEFTPKLLESTFSIPRGIADHELLGDDTGGSYTRLLAARKTGIILNIVQVRRGKKRGADEDNDDRPHVRRRLAGEEESSEEDGEAGAGEGAPARGHGRGRGGGGRGGRRGHQGNHRAAVDDDEEEPEDRDDDDAGVEQEGDIDEEEERDAGMAGLRMQLEHKWRCHSRTCTSDFCWINADANHVPLKNPHFRVWIEVLLNKTDGVKLDKPPNHLHFDLQHALKQVLDREAVIRGRHGRGQENQQIIIHNHMPGTVVNENAPPPPPPAEPRCPLQNILNKPRLTLEEFCTQYHLSEAIQEKARGIAISGAHGFYLVSAAALEENFQPGEVADIEWAKQAWAAAD